MKIGSVPYLNAKPLIWGLDRESEVELIYEFPSKLAVMLREGDLAAGMVSVAACFDNPNLQIAPGMSISCIGPAASVKVFYNDDVEAIRKVALDTSSLTSVLLARVILRERYGLSPEFVDMPPSLDVMLSECDAAVTIGDVTMCVPEGKWQELDLGQEWKGLTGLPFVFAVWAVNPKLATTELNHILANSKTIGLRSLEAISQSESERLGLPKDICLRYLRKIMNYDLTDKHIQGLMLFREKARQYGYIAGDHPIKLFEPNNE